MKILLREREWGAKRDGSGRGYNNRLEGGLGGLRYGTGKYKGIE